MAGGLTAAAPALAQPWTTGGAPPATAAPEAGPRLQAVGARGPALLGFTLGMPLESAVRTARSIAPAGSVTLPPVRREAFVLVAVEAPVALRPPVDARVDPRDNNFYLLLNSAPRVLRNQPTRSSHVNFITLVADANDRRVVRVVFEPALVHWAGGLDAGKLSAAALAESLGERLGVDVRLVDQPPRPGSREPATGGQARGARDGRDREGASRERPGAQVPTSVRWELRVHADRRSVVLTDPMRLPDEQAGRLRLN